MLIDQPAPLPRVDRQGVELFGRYRYQPVPADQPETRFNVHPLINHTPSLLAGSDFNMISSWLSLATARTCALMYNRLLINISGYKSNPLHLDHRLEKRKSRYKLNH